MNPDSILSALNDNEIVTFTRRFVQTASVNGEEQAAALFLANTLEEAGLQVSVREIQPGRPNVIAVWPGEQPHVGLAFHGHTDTVPYFNMKDPLSGAIVDESIWGRGSVDQKGGLSASALAVMMLARANLHLKKGVAILAVIDEESEHRGSYALVDEGYKADFAITTEPSDLQLLVANKGTAPIRVEFTGRLAHGSNPWAGVNAIEMAAKTITEIKNVPLREVEIPGVGTMRASFNIGLIEGGTQYNNVAHSCSIFIDRRCVPGETQTTALSEINDLLARLAAEDPTFKSRAEIARPDWKWEPIRQRGLKPALTPPDSPVAQAIARAHTAVTGQKVQVGFTNGYNDGDFLVNDLGIPTVNYGPGESQRSHTAEEKLRIDHLLTAVRVYLRTAFELAG
jgi:acetylornithine deacetylase/succinyl-diaminopimelate desuccinylase family protein